MSVDVSVDVSHPTLEPNPLRRQNMEERRTERAEPHFATRVELFVRQTFAQPEEFLPGPLVGVVVVFEQGGGHRQRAEGGRKGSQMFSVFR